VGLHSQQDAILKGWHARCTFKGSAAIQEEPIRNAQPIQTRNNRVIEVVLDDAEAAGEHDRQVSASVDKRALIVRRELIDT